MLKNQKRLKHLNSFLDSTLTKIYLRVTVSVALLFSISSALTNQKGEFDSRYLWVVRNSLTTKLDIDNMIEFATLNRFNNILVQVRGRGDAYYKSNLVSKSILIKDKDFDPLAYIIPKAKEKGIRVHAWVNTYLLWSSRRMPVQKNHVLKTNPDWIDQNSKKKINISTEMKKFNGGKNGIEGFYLAPNHPKVNSYLLTIFNDLIHNYDLDGLHLDYVRFHDSDYGQNPSSVSYFQKKTGISDSPSFDISQSSQWSDYRRKAVTELVRETKNLIQSVKPSITLTAAVKPNLYQARERFFQEWDVWLAAGYLDKAIVMNYTKDLKEFAANIDIMYDNLPSKYRKKIVMGIATYNQSPKNVVDKIKYTRVTRFNSVSFFSYTVMYKDPSYFKPIKNILYPRD